VGVRRITHKITYSFSSEIIIKCWSLQSLQEIEIHFFQKKKEKKKENEIHRQSTQIKELVQILLLPFQIQNLMIFLP
jgi:hypothetical protein